MNPIKAYKINTEKMAYRITDGEALILNLDDAYYYVLNETGTRIWGFIDKGKDTGEILGLLKKEYPDIPEKRLKNDISDLIRTLESEKMIIPASQ